MGIRMKNKYRIVRDDRGIYYPQVRHSWLPFVWFDIGHYNGYVFLNDAEMQITISNNRRTVVKYVD